MHSAQPETCVFLRYSTIHHHQSLNFVSIENLTLYFIGNKYQAQKFFTYNILREKVDFRWSSTAKLTLLHAGDSSEQKSLEII